MESANPKITVSSATAAPATEASIATQQSTQRTVLSFQRTRLSADRTLMSVMRTSLSLIGFGFTIFQFFHKIREMGGLQNAPERAPRNFGLALTLLGMGMLTVGIWYHIRFMYQVRKERVSMQKQVTIPEGDSFPVSLSLIAATLLLLISIVALISMISDVASTP
jgi:putative membrane protein